MHRGWSNIISGVVLHKYITSFYDGSWVWCCRILTDDNKLLVGSCGKNTLEIGDRVNFKCYITKVYGEVNDELYGAVIFFRRLNVVNLGVN